jgi:peptidoglycan/LPS O-acetylase OafA/YrhL
VTRVAPSAAAAGSPAPALAADAPNLTPPPGNPRFPLFDSLRAIAALLVFAGHTVTGTYSFVTHPDLFVWAAQCSYEGVAVFFLISGFLLYRPFLTARRGGRSLSLPDYARRRVLRIVPAYWVALTIFIVLGLVSGVTTSNWWRFYGFGQIYSPKTIGSGIGVAWTLCIEVTFYIALPLFAFLAARASKRRDSVRGDVVLLALFSLASLAYRAHYSSFFELQKVSTLPGTFFWFALGMGLAVASVRIERPPLRVPRWWPVLSWAIAIGLWVLLHETAAHPGTLGTTASSLAIHVLYGLGAFFLLLPAVFGEREGGSVRRLLSLGWLAWVGLVSYAFYLYHTIVIMQFDKLAHHAHIALRYAFVAGGSLVVSLVCAAASYYLLERPIMRLGRRRRSGARA